MLLHIFVTMCVFVGINIFNLHQVAFNFPAFVRHLIAVTKKEQEEQEPYNQEFRLVQVLKYTDQLVVSDFIARSEPVVIDGMPHELFEPLRTHYPILLPPLYDYKNDTMIIRQHMFPLRLGPLGAEINRLTGGRRTVYLASMSGTYSAGVAHIDSFASYNFYYVQKGTKEVFIVPHEHTSLINLRSGIDNVFVAEDDDDDHDWLDRLPYYYRFMLNESQVLIFNNAKCVHKFINQGIPYRGAEQIYTMRLFSTDPDMTALRNDFFHWRQAQEYASILIRGTILRRMRDVTGEKNEYV